MPRGGHYNPGRQAVYDRSPANQALQYQGAAVAPHGLTNRWTRTVPAGLRAQVQLVSGQIMRVTAAAPVGQVQMLVSVVCSGNTAQVLMLQMLTNTAGDQQHAEFGGEILLAPGDTVACATQDASTGGTVNYNTGALSVEFSQ